MELISQKLLATELSQFWKTHWAFNEMERNRIRKKKIFFMAAPYLCNKKIISIITFIY